MPTKNSWKKARVGSVFGVPLLAGGYAFGYIVALSPSEPDFALANLFDLVSDGRVPAAGLEQTHLIHSDLLISEAGFASGADHKPWFWLDREMTSVPAPKRRYAIAPGDKPWRIDMTGVESDTEATSDELARYPRLSVGSSIGETAEVEVLVRKLNENPADLVRRWRATAVTGESQRQRGNAKQKSTGKPVDFAPFEFLMHNESTQHHLLWADAAFTHYERLFEKMNADCNGYTWSAIIEALVRLKEPKLFKRLSFDPEAGTVSISGARSDLAKVALMMRELLADKAMLSDAVAMRGGSDSP